MNIDFSLQWARALAWKIFHYSASTFSEKTDAVFDNKESQRKERDPNSHWYERDCHSSLLVHLWGRTGRPGGQTVWKASLACIPRISSDLIFFIFNYPSQSSRVSNLEENLASRLNTWANIRNQWLRFCKLQKPYWEIGK